MNNKVTHTPETLEEIAAQKAILQQQINSQQILIKRLSRQLLAPLPPAIDKASSISRAFKTGMAMFDGLRLGIKLMRKFRKTFKKDI